MKTKFFISVFTLLLMISLAGTLSAQDIKGGVVKYKQTINFNFDKVFNPNGDARPGVKEWISSLPKSRTSAKVLYFTTDFAFYETDKSVKEESLDQGPRGLQRAIMGAAARKPPTPEIEKAYYDFKKNEMTTQYMFMTRNFTVTDPIKKPAWKLTNKNSKILNYNCMSAEIKIGEETYVAWFTPEIPISAGPDLFYGLPGLVLAVEANGKFTHVATEVSLTVPGKDSIVKPDKGRIMDRKEFDKTVKDKVEEWKNNRRRRR